MTKLMFYVMTALMLTSVPTFAQETPQDQYICKVQAGNCLKRVDAIQRKMKKLEADIKNGKKVSADELKKLEEKLIEVEQMLDKLKAK